MVKISVSILAANFSQEAIDRASSADMIHFDVMDGEFVPKKTIWSDEVAELKTTLIKDVHLMIENPEEYVEEFIDAGAERIAFHVEATDNPEAVIGLIQSKGIKAGITLNPETPIEKIVDFLDSVDFVLIMSVRPGEGGQSFMNESLEKIKMIKKAYPKLEIEIDGGINAETAKLAKEAGVDTLVVGTFIFSGEPKERIRELR
ncbi:MAG: ribulose-phosphate 3-epimerase [Nanoarchaeota archaeon]|nr:ribulose-phosphate 3-epimerase [Nanoarchaeota archaeon]MBU1269232.1 ribulose-phosphate 3-epimerase [Nanoarchaeota archaeon]MBU1604918.1 ribulose-phosphate 3-epimerase [Nanoarchaeota archaeon]MBU2443514.1 ribulose-phosphate 3-epimerase [Nanoarchaeota archaeon]